MLHASGTRRTLAGLAVAMVVGLGVPPIALAHAELESSTPADGSTVPATFEGPVVLTFSAALADGSKADLLGPDGATVASAVVDGPGATMTIRIEATLQAELTSGEYEVRWVSVAEDGDLERGTVTFSVAAAPTTPPPTTTPTASAAATTPPPAAATPTPAPTVSAAPPSPSASPDPGPTGSSAADVILPIVVLLVVVGAGAVYLLSRRNRPSPGR